MTNTLNTRKNPMQSTGLAFKIVAYVILMIFTVWVLAPFCIIILTSLTSQSEVLNTVGFVGFPKEGITLDAFKTALTEDIWLNGISTIIGGFVNTIWMTIPTTIIGLFISGLSAYAFAKMRFRLSNTLYYLTLATMMIPGTVLIVPQYLLFESIGWVDTALPLMIPGMFGNAATVFFLRQFFMGVPNDLIEAAKLDGLGYFKTYVKIIMPLCAPAFLAQGIFIFVGGYNNYMGPLLYIQSNMKLFPLQTALNAFVDYFGTSKFPLHCASALVALLPMLIIYIVCQKFFVESIASAGVKG